MAVAVAPLSSINQGVLEVLKTPYPLLADPNHKVTEELGVYNLLGDGLAAPSVFVVDTDRTIVWSYVGQASNDRPSADTLLDVLP